MYLGVDVGGTKTLLAVFTEDGQLKQTLKFETPKDYNKFLETLADNIESLEVDDFSAACIAMPGLIDRKNGVVIAFGNLEWKNVHIVESLKQIINAPISVENDAKLGALYEGTLIKNEFRKVLYVTIGTGISAGLIVDGIIDPELADSESGQMLLQYSGGLKKWESFASGKAIREKYGKNASDITSEDDWKTIAHTFALGLIDLIAVLQPEVIVLGGGVSTNFDKFKAPLQSELKKYEMPLVPIPPIRKAEKPEEAVIYGCYLFAKQLSAK